MSALDDMLDGHNQYRYTEQEIIEFANSLSQEKRDLFLDTLTNARSRGMDVHSFACKAIDRIKALEASRRPSIIETLAAITEGWALGGIISGSKKINVKEE